MLKYTALLVSVSVASTMFACSSDDGDEDGAGASAAGGTGTVVNVTGGANGIGDQNGGTTPLTQDQITQIQTGACAGWTTEGEPLPAVLMLVVDVSGSMTAEAPPGDRDQNACAQDNNCTSKWDVTRDALTEAIGDLGATSSVGVLYYPNQEVPDADQPGNVDRCVNTDELVAIDLLGADGSMHRDAVLQSLQDANTGSYTPTHDAYTYGLDSGLRPYSTDSPKFMLLITDGAPTASLGCVKPNGNVQDMPTDPIIATVAAAAADGIKTFIIGSPGSEVSSESNTDMRPWLSEAAMVGGTAIPGCANTGPNFCHMDMTQAPDFGAALRAGLGSVAQQIATCTYTIPAPPPGMAIDTTAVNLIVHSTTGSVLVLPDGQGTCTEGWTYDADGNVHLCDATCAAVQADPSARVELLFGCASGDIPVF